MSDKTTAIDPALAQALVETARRAADAARAPALRYFRVPALLVEDKGGGRFDPVTQADRETEAAMRAVLAECRPDDAILGEELGARPGDSGIGWILDPIDGTRGYLAGTPTWGVLIAATHRGRPVLGIVDQPHIGERFLGGLGLAEMTGPGGTRPLATRPPRPLAEAVVFTTFPEIGTEDERAGFQAVAGRARLVRYGMDCYAYALVALGQVDLVIEAGLQPYDIAAPLALIEAAGGVVTDWRGGDASGGGRVVAAANARIHAEALAVLQTVR